MNGKVWYIGNDHEFMSDRCVLIMYINQPPLHLINRTTYAIPVPTGLMNTVNVYLTIPKFYVYFSSST